MKMKKISLGRLNTAVAVAATLSKSRTFAQHPPAPGGLLSELKHLAAINGETTRPARKEANMKSIAVDIYMCECVCTRFCSMMVVMMFFILHYIAVYSGIGRWWPQVVVCRSGFLLLRCTMSSQFVSGNISCICMKCRESRTRERIRGNEGEIGIDIPNRRSQVRRTASISLCCGHLYELSGASSSIS